MKKAIHEIAEEILAEYKKPMTADEIYDVIASRSLYDFKAKSPRSVLKNQLRRHAANVQGPNQAKTGVFELSSIGTFTLVKR